MPYNLSITRATAEMADDILKFNLKSVEQELTSMLDNGSKLASTSKLENCRDGAVLCPENWSEMVSMCANIFSTQGISLFDDFMKMAPHIVESYFEPTNCTNYAPKKPFQYNRQNVLVPRKSEGYWNGKRCGQQKPTNSGQNFNKRFPRRAASFPVVPNIESNYDDVSFDSLQIGPQFRYKSSFAKINDLFRRTCECLTNLAKERHILEIKIFQTRTETTAQHDYSKDPVNFRLLNNLHFIIKTALNEAAMIEWILSNAELQVKDYICAGKVVVTDVRNAAECLKAIFNQLCSTKTPYDELCIVECLDNLVMSVKCAHSYLWTVNVLIKTETYIDGVTQRGTFIGS